MVEKFRLLSKEFILIATFLILLILKDFAGVNVPSILFTVVWFAIILFCSTNVGGAFSIASVICFASTISITIPIVFYMLVVLVRRKKIGRFNSVFVISIIVAVIELARVFLLKDESFNVYVNTMAVVFLTATIITGILNGDIDASMCLKFYLALFVFLSVDIIWATAKVAGNISGIISGSFRIGQVDLFDSTMEGLLGMNSNGIALLAMVAVAVIFLMFNKRYLSLLWAIIGIVFAAFVGFLTVSKTFILVFAGMYVLYLIWHILKSNGKTLTPIFVLAVSIVAFIVLPQTTIVKNVLDRFSSGDLTTGRIDVANEYLGFMFKDFSRVILGMGLQNITIKSGFVHVPHNAILEIFVCFGISGMIMFSVFFVNLIKMNKEYRKNNNLEKSNFINYLPIIVYVVFIQSLQFMRINYIYAMIAIVFACLMLKNNKNEGGF